MAGNMHVIFSETIKGSGLIDGTTYYGRQPGNDAAVNINQAKSFSSKGKIDNVSNLNGHPVYVLSFGRHRNVQQGEA